MTRKGESVRTRGEVNFFAILCGRRLLWTAPYIVLVKGDGRASTPPCLHMCKPFWCKNLVYLPPIFLTGLEFKSDTFKQLTYCNRTNINIPIAC